MKVKLLFALTLVWALSLGFIGNSHAYNAGQLNGDWVAKCIVKAKNLKDVQHCFDTFLICAKRGQEENDYDNVKECADDRENFR